MVDIYSVLLMPRNGTKHYRQIISPVVGGGAFILPILQMGKERHREVKSNSQDY